MEQIFYYLQYISFALHLVLLDQLNQEHQDGKYMQKVQTEYKTHKHAWGYI
jgi:hypothetical protein